jgi:eukaryotic-like serine/threonine-protein kinase
MYCGNRLPEQPEQLSPQLEAAIPQAEPQTIILSPLDDATGSVPSHVETTDFVMSGTTESPVERVGCYRLIKKLGSGGMGHVFEAESDENGERVALKLLSPKLITNPNSVERFKQEGRLASQISHPRCVFVYGVDADEERPFIVMELMPGSTLKDLVDARGPLPWVGGIHRILDVIEGLIEAHRLGMLHRDVKPTNCFLTTDDRVKIGDFGLSKSLDSQHHQRQLTNTGAFLGTVLFASPEQIRGQEVGYDSDVYSVAATLYYLLMGKAPHHHISMTAALAKVISEPPASIRAKRPEVPYAVERVIFKGLERDRNRRYASLEEFRDALLDILPERQQPSRVRSLVGAYLIDFFVCWLFFALPLEWLMESVLPVHANSISTLNNILQALILTLYFGITEGYTGGTVGKLLLRLRVTQIGQMGPPGIRRSLYRSFVFHFAFLAVLLLVSVVFQLPFLGPLIAVGILVGSAFALIYQRRRSNSHRGFHDLVSGCRVVQRPQGTPPIRLVGLTDNPLDRAKKDETLPPLVGGFSIVGVLMELEDEEAIWVAEDEALNRRILLWVRPARQLPDGVPPSPVRPGRLRVVSTGELLWKNGAYAWVAFVAPTGAPLMDTIAPSARLSWADSRMILEQLVRELKEGQADSTNPSRLGVNQLWVEPSGRLHLLEFPLPTHRPAPEVAKEPMQLIRQLTTLLLEGQARNTGGGLKAALPLPAARAMNSFFENSEPSNLEQIHRTLVTSYQQPAEVTTGMRTGHIGLLLAISGFGLLLMALGSLSFSLQIAFLAGQNANFSRSLLTALSDAETVERWKRVSPKLAEYLEPNSLEVVRRNSELFQAREQELWELLRGRLSRFERGVAEQILESQGDSWVQSTEESDRKNLELLMKRIIDMPTDRIRIRTDQPRFAIFWIFMILVVLAIFVLFAFVFRGGLSYNLTGIALVQKDGQLATRWMCALRELVIMIPLVLLLTVNILMQVYYPESLSLRLTLTIVIGLLLMGYLVVGIRYSTRGPQDRLVGTYMVPA